MGKKSNDAEMHNINCPRCNSKKVHVEKKGFGYDDACCGWLLLGPIGLLCGGLESKKLEGHCLNCGKRFDAQSQARREWENQQEDEPKWECEYCGKKFDTKKSTEKHEKKCKKKKS